MNADLLWIFITLLVVGIAALSALAFLEAKRAKGAVVRSLNMALFLVRLPREQKGDDRRTDRERIGVMEQLIASLSMFHASGAERLVYGDPQVAFEMAVHHVGEEIHFYVSGPTASADLIQRTVHGFYPDASVQRAPDFNVFTPHGAHAASTLTLTKQYFLPVRTYQSLESDPLNNISNALSKLEREGEGAAVQVVMQHTDGTWAKRSVNVAKLMQQGHSYEKAAQQVGGGVGNFARDIASGGVRKDPAKEKAPQALTPMAQETIKGIEQKASKVGFAVNVRLVASAQTQLRAEKILEQLENSFTQFTHPSSNGFKVKRAKGRGLRALLYEFSFRMFVSDQAMLLNTEELAGLFHFPLPNTATPRVAWLKAKAAPPPENLPDEASSPDALVLGDSSYRGETKAVRMLREDRRRHLYIIGQTGTGKSVMLQELIRQDIERGEGVAVIDPHGELAEGVLGIIPPERAEDVVYFDPGDTARPMGLNMLEAKTPDQRDFAVQEMIAIFMKLFPPEVIGPMFEHNMRNAMLTLMADPENPGTLVEIPRIFTDDAFTKKLLVKVTDPIVRAFWEKEMAKTSDYHKSEMMGYLVSKVGRFVENELMRNIIGQPKSGFNFREVMDGRKILIANLSKGRVGEVNSSLLGMILVSKLQMAAMTRADTDTTNRPDFYLYIDEFQNFTTDSIATILSEARKYRLNLTMAHQFIAQLPASIKDAAFGNVGSVLSLRVSTEDAAYLEKQFQPVFSQNDLMGLDNFNAVARLLIRQETSRPFNLLVRKYWERGVKVDPERAAAIKELSRLKYARPREVVGAEILERSQLARVAPATPQMTPGEHNV